MMRWSPSRTSTVLRSLAAMSLTICSSSRTFIGPPAPSPGGEPGRAARSPPPPLRFFFSLNVATLEGPVEVGQKLASGVGDEHVVLDAHAALARQVDARLDGDNHAGAEFLLAAGLAHGGQLVDVATDAVAEPVAELLAEAGAVDDVPGDAV